MDIEANPFVYSYQIKDFKLDGNESLIISGLSNTITVLCKEREEWSIYESDEYGFNNPKKLYDLNEIDFVFIGDSFIHGHCVKQDETITSQFRLNYPNSINLGIGGIGSLIKLAIVKEYVEQLKPKVVFWFYTQETLFRLFEDYNLSKISSKYLNSNFKQNLIYKQKEIDKEIKDYIDSDIIEINLFLKFITFHNLRRFILDTIYNLKQINNYVKISQEQFNFNNDEIIELNSGKKIKFQDISRNFNTFASDPPKFLSNYYEKILHKANSIVSNYGGQLILIYLPTGSNDNDINTSSTKTDHSIILKSFQKINVPIIDLYEDFSYLKCSQIWKDGKCEGHFDSKGYKLISDLLVEKYKKIIN